MEFDPPKTKTERVNHYYMMDALRRFEWDMHHTIYREQRIPSAWHEIAAEKRSAKVRVSLSLDADVVKFFKSMGPGYQPRINQVLRGFMHMKLRGLLRGEETTEEMKAQMTADDDRPDWGETEADLAAFKARRDGRRTP
ncbi:hypothetical protein HKCCE3408_13180 [Rhodobacterales bacterium HKCCE3408]|nr:hypothetical protein [Rhodobacterales bacterium HKCCE3408]